MYFLSLGKLHCVFLRWGGLFFGDLNWSGFVDVNWVRILGLAHELCHDLFFTTISPKATITLLCLLWYENLCWNIDINLQQMLSRGSSSSASSHYQIFVQSLCMTGLPRTSECRSHYPRWNRFVSKSEKWPPETRCSVNTSGNINQVGEKKQLEPSWPLPLPNWGSGWYQQILPVARKG